MIKTPKSPSPRHCSRCDFLCESYKKDFFWKFTLPTPFTTLRHKLLTIFLLIFKTSTYDKKCLIDFTKSML